MRFLTIYREDLFLNGSMLYALNILQETEVLGCKHVRTPMDAYTDLWDEFGPLLENVTQYKRLVGSLFISL